MSRLDEILDAKRAEVARLRARVLASELGLRAKAAPPPRPFCEALRRRAGEPPHVIAEVKFASPVAGVLRETHDPAEIAKGYEAAGAAAISVLCDTQFFGGGWEDLEAARAATDCPILAKEFVVDPWQVVRARAAGADAVLLLARALDDASLAGLSRVVRSLGMEPLVEAADEDEVDRALAVGASVVGINRRDLRTFEIDPTTFDRLLPRLPSAVVAIAMSDVGSREDYEAMARTRADAVLVGSALMRAPDPGRALGDWLRRSG